MTENTSEVQAGAAQPAMLYVWEGLGGTFQLSPLSRETCALLKPCFAHDVKRQE